MCVDVSSKLFILMLFKPIKMVLPSDISPSSPACFLFKWLCSDCVLVEFVYRSVTLFSLMESWLHPPKWVSRVLHHNLVVSERKELVSCSV